MSHEARPCGCISDNGPGDLLGRGRTGTIAPPQAPSRGKRAAQTAASGAVQDFLILCASMRRDGKSLGQIAKEEVNPVAGLRVNRWRDDADSRAALRPPSRHRRSWSACGSVRRGGGCAAPAIRQAWKSGRSGKSGRSKFQLLNFLSHFPRFHFSPFLRNRSARSLSRTAASAPTAALARTRSAAVGGATGWEPPHNHNTLPATIRASTAARTRGEPIRKRR